MSMTRRHRRNAASFHPSVEFLERRWVPATLTPTTFADGGPGSGSLRDAVFQFNADTGIADDTIQLQAGTYALTIQNVGGRHETAGLTGDLNLTKASHHWIIQGAGPSTLIDASQLHDRVFDIVTPGTQVVFRDLVIQGGLAQDNGLDGVSALSTDALGGGLLNNGGTVTLDHVVLTNNVAQGGPGFRGANGRNAQGGGIYSLGGSLTISGSTLTNNQAIGGRGADYFFSSHIGGGGTAAGGGLYASGGSLDISDSTVVSNRATGGRGGDGHIVHTTTTTFTYAGGPGGRTQGGGLYVNGGSLTIATSTVASNQATAGDAGAYGNYLNGSGEGGGLYNSGTLTVSSCTLAGNSASDPVTDINSGGGIFNDGTLTVSNCTLAGNSGGEGGFGGGIDNHGTLTVTGSTLSGNSGIGIANEGTLTVTGSTLSGNSGIGIDTGGTLTVSDSTLSGNSRGGIFNGGTLTVSNSTITGNTASGAGTAGGITNSAFNANATAILLNCTIANNTGGQLFAGHTGIGTGRATIQLRNTIISGDGSRPNVFADSSGTFTSQGHNLSSDDGSGFLTGPGDLINTDPLLGPLQNNGGPTQTMALLLGSPAIDAGDNTGASNTDQRGFPRIVGGTIDIGTFEVQPAGQATHLSIQAPASISAGTPFTIMVTALDDLGQPATGYTGTVRFMLSGPVTAMADYTFTTTDGGQHTFINLVLRRAGTYTVAGADNDNPLINGNTAFTITPAAAAHVVFNVPNSITAGVRFAITVTVQDGYGNTVTDYAGTVHFMLTGQAMAQADYTFTTSDMGSRTFNVVLSQPGDYTLTGSDPDAGIDGSVSFPVDPG
jgi:hypothetical protein